MYGKSSTWICRNFRNNNVLTRPMMPPASFMAILEQTFVVLKDEILPRRAE